MKEMKVVILGIEMNEHKSIVLAGVGWVRQQAASAAANPMLDTQTGERSNSRCHVYTTQLNGYMVLVYIFINRSTRHEVVCRGRGCIGKGGGVVGVRVSIRHLCRGGGVQLKICI